jgi:hypothetical protein
LAGSASTAWRTSHPSDWATIRSSTVASGARNSRATSLSGSSIVAVWRGEKMVEVKR